MEIASDGIGLLGPVLASKGKTQTPHVPDSARMCARELRPLTRAPDFHPSGADRTAAPLPSCPVIVAAVIALAGLISLVAGSPG